MRERFARSPTADRHGRTQRHRSVMCSLSSFALARSKAKQRRSIDKQRHRRRQQRRPLTRVGVRVQEEGQSGRKSRATEGDSITREAAAAAAAASEEIAAVGSAAALLSPLPLSLSLLAPAFECVRLSLRSPFSCASSSLAPSLSLSPHSQVHADSLRLAH